jgi:hypothetical protein
MDHSRLEPPKELGRYRKEPRNLVRFPGETTDYLLPSDQTGSRAHPTSSPMGTVGSFPGSKAAGA